MGVSPSERICIAATSRTPHLMQFGRPPLRLHKMHCARWRRRVRAAPAVHSCTTAALEPGADGGEGVEMGVVEFGPGLGDAPGAVVQGLLVRPGSTGQASNGGKAFPVGAGTSSDECPRGKLSVGSAAAASGVVGCTRTISPPFATDGLSL